MTNNFPSTNVVDLVIMPKTRSVEAKTKHAIAFLRQYRAPGGEALERVDDGTGVRFRVPSHITLSGVMADAEREMLTVEVA